MDGNIMLLDLPAATHSPRQEIPTMPRLGSHGAIVLAYLSEERSVLDVMLHIERSRGGTYPVLQTLADRGLAVRIASGGYCRSELGDQVIAAASATGPQQLILGQSPATPDADAGIAARVQLAPDRLSQPTPTARAILACLTQPYSVVEIAAHTGRSLAVIRQTLRMLFVGGHVVCPAWGHYARCPDAPGSSLDAPDATTDAASLQRRRRPDTMQERIYAFLEEPRSAKDISLHIDRSVPNVTGQLRAMTLNGIVVRISWGRYARADVCPDAPAPGSITRNHPMGDILLAHLDAATDLDDLAKRTGRTPHQLRDDARCLQRKGYDLPDAIFGRGRTKLRQVA